MNAAHHPGAPQADPTAPGQARPPPLDTTGPFKEKVESMKQARQRRVRPGGRRSGQCSQARALERREEHRRAQELRCELSEAAVVAPSTAQLRELVARLED